MEAARLKINVPPRVSIRDMVYENIKDQIMTHQIIPSMRLVDVEIAKQIGYSRTPVREALHLLENEGLLETMSQGGYHIKPLDWREFVQLCEIRTLNETLAAHWAIDSITPEEIRALDENLIQSESEIQDGDPRSFVNRDAQFHAILIKASNSERLIELCERLRCHMFRYRIGGLYLKEVTLRALGEHQRIFDCIRKRDKKGVAAAIKNHLEMVRRSVQENAFKVNKREENQK